MSRRLWPTPTGSGTRPNEGNVRILRARVLDGTLTEEEAKGMLNGKSPFEAQGKLGPHSAASSPASAASTSDSSGQAGTAASRSSGTPSASESSPSTGLMFPGLATSTTSTGLWPTPRAEKIGGYSSPGWRPTLAQAVNDASRPLISSPAVFPASLSPSRASSDGWTTIVGYGPSSREPFASYVLPTFSSKTYPDSLREAMDPEDAYAAGLVDGEGSLTITRSSRYYSPRVEVGMTAPALPLLRSMQERYGGSVSKMRSATERWAEAWRWVITGRPATEMVLAIRPMLRVKAAQADVILRLSTVASSSPEAMALKAEINELNQKGPRSARTAAGRWVTPQTGLMGQWETFSGSWPTTGLMVNGRAFPRQPLVPRTSVTGSGSSEPVGPNSDGMWPTPTTGDHSTRFQQGGMPLGMAARMSWPPPTARDHKDGQYNPNVPVNGLLGRAVWRTPQARDGDPRGTQTPEKRAAGGHSIGLDDQVGGALNPTWVEWLQGFPLGWTTLEDE